MTDLRNGLPLGHGLEGGGPAHPGTVYLECICGASEVVNEGEAERQWFFDHAKDRAGMLARIKARLDAATPGVWTAERESCDCEGGCFHGSWTCAIHGPKNISYSGKQWADQHNRVSEVCELADEDVSFIVRAPTDMAFLFEELARVTAERDQARKDTTPRGGW